jgi:hypothetical protein
MAFARGSRVRRRGMFGAIANGRRTSTFTTAWNRMGHEG